MITPLASHRFTDQSQVYTLNARSESINYRAKKTSSNKMREKRTFMISSGFDTTALTTPADIPEARCTGTPFADSGTL